MLDFQDLEHEVILARQVLWRRPDRRASKVRLEILVRQFVTSLQRCLQAFDFH